MNSSWDRGWGLAEISPRALARSGTGRWEATESIAFYTASKHHKLCLEGVRDITAPSPLLSFPRSCFLPVP